MLESHEIKIRVWLSRALSDGSAFTDFAEGLFSTLDAREVNRVMEPIRRALHFAEQLDGEEALVATLRRIQVQLEAMQAAVREQQPADQQRAMEIVAEIQQIRTARNQPLRRIDLEDLVGALVLNVGYPKDVIGRIVRFDPEEPGWLTIGIIGDVFIQPADDQQSLRELFNELYAYGMSNDDPSFGLYHLPDAFPVPTFLEPLRKKDLVPVRLGVKDVAKRDVAKRPARHKKANIVRMRHEDRRIGTPIYSVRKEQWGVLREIWPSADGSEQWGVVYDGDETSEVVVADRSAFSLQIQEYRSFLLPRVLEVNTIYETLIEAWKTNHAFHETLDEVQSTQDDVKKLHSRLESLKKTLNGDIEEDKTQKRIAGLFDTMIWNSAYTNEEQREYIARQVASQIFQIRLTDQQEGTL